MLSALLVGWVGRVFAWTFAALANCAAAKMLPANNTVKERRKRVRLAIE
jgi:hypothetical protein